MSTARNVRLGIIGMGNMGKFHADYLLAGKVPRAALTAVCSTSPAKLEHYKSVKIFDDGEKLIRSGAVDAVVIATPHYQHTSLGIAAFEAGVHVMAEMGFSTITCTPASKAAMPRLVC